MLSNLQLCLHIAHFRIASRFGYVLVTHILHGRLSVAGNTYGVLGRWYIRLMQYKDQESVPITTCVPMCMKIKQRALNGMSGETYQDYIV